MKHRRLLAITGAIAAVISLGASGAYAYWSASGLGSGTAPVGAPVAVTVLAATASPSTTLVPGGTADLVIQLNNPNSSPVTLVGVSQNGTTVTPVGGTGPGTPCSTTNAGVSVPTQVGLTITVASGSNVVARVPNGASMSTGSASGCQGATFRVPVNVTVRR